MRTPENSLRSRPTPLLLAGVASLSLVVSACSSSGEQSDSTEVAATACATVEAPVEPIDSQGAEEPVLAIPTPAGWTRETSQDSAVVRYALANSALSRDNFAPNAVVTLDVVPGVHDPQALFDASRAALTEQNAGKDVTFESTTVCGQPAEVVEYTCFAAGAAPERPCSGLSVVYSGTETTYLASVTVQTTDGDNPTFLADKETILSGFQVLPPTV